MTGDVPYYGGRLTPAHVYGVQHAGQRPAPPPAPRPAPRPARSVDEQLAMLEALREEGTITAEEYQTLRARIAG